jgi:hypothetical protein
VDFMTERRKLAVAMLIIAAAALASIAVFILEADFDRDGLKNRDEFSLGTDIFKFDTDGDGIGDGVEVGETWHNFELKQNPGGIYSFAWTELVEEF